MINSVKVLIPLYKTSFGLLEEKSFLQCVKVLKNLWIGEECGYVTILFSCRFMWEGSLF